MTTATKLFEKPQRQTHSKLFTAAMVATGAVVTGVVAAALHQVERNRLRAQSITGSDSHHDEELARLEGEGGPPAPAILPAQKAKS